MGTEIATLDQVDRMAVAIAKSGLFGIKTPDQALALMLIAQAEGTHPASAAQDYDIVQGRPARKTHSVLARFQQAGGSVRWLTLDEQTAEAEFSHAQGGTVAIRWTIDMARRAGLANKDNWKNYPRAMLRARCIAEGVRTVYPAAIGGLLVTEEASDLPAVRDMGPAQVVGQPAEASPDYLAFEAANLPALELAAEGGTQSLQAAFSAVPAGDHKSAMWRAHSARLKGIAGQAGQRQEAAP